jgi:hypothetical protein
VKSTGLLIAASLLLLLTGVIWWSNKKEAVASKPDANAAPKILSLDASAVTSLTIRHKDQGTLTLDRDHEAWRITAPAPLQADRESVSSLVSTLSSLSSEHLIEDKVSDRAAYGLADPALELTITLEDRQTRKLLIGDQTPAGNAYYAMLEGDPRVFTVAAYNKTSLDKTSNDLRDKRLLTADFDKVSQIELSNQKGGKKQEITFARNKDAWQILRPVPCRAASDQVQDLVRSLGDAKMELTAASDAAKAAAAFSSGSPFASVKVTGASGTETLEIRKSKDDYYAKSSAVAGVFQIAAPSASALDKSLDDFRDKKLFDFGYQDPDKIEVHAGAASYFFTRSGGDWWGPDGKKLDGSTVEPLVEKLRGLAAAKFPESGFSAPALELRVTSNETKRVEQVALAKQGDAYLAKRENEPALYQLPGKDIEELEELCKKVKPKAAPQTAAPKK